MKTSAERRYESPLRQEQSDQTRERILDAVIEVLAASGLHGFKIAEVARRAGVAERTVYRHFPDREALITALDERTESIGGGDLPDRLGDLGPAVTRLFPLLDAHEPLARARLQTDLGQEARHRDRRRQARRLSGLLAEETDLSATGRRRAAAVLHHFMSSETWRMMKDEYGFDGVEAALATRWAVERLVAALLAGDDGLDAR